MTDYARETRLARGHVPALDRATIHPYEDATPGPVYYQRDAHAVGLEAERVLGDLDGGHGLLFSSGSTTPCSARSFCARSSTAPTSSCTARQRSWPATTTRCSGP